MHVAEVLLEHFGWSQGPYLALTLIELCLLDVQDQRGVGDLEVGGRRSW